MVPGTKNQLKKNEQDRLHSFIVELLREEENKHCADCLAKQPRWASWNLGVFICIKCAGIHRNMGVHISKVKSVNLDSWTAEQVQSMRLMGNAKAKQVYESELPNHFRRPTTDQALESFIRGKYEHKRFRYILPNWIPPKVNAEDLPLHPIKHAEFAPRISTQENKEVRPSILSPRNSQLLTFDRTESHDTSPKLLDLSTSETNSTYDPTEKEDVDEFGDFFGSTASSNSSKNNLQAHTLLDDLAGLSLGETSTADEVKSKSEILALYKNGVRNPGLGEIHLGYNVHDPKSWACAAARQVEVFQQNIPRENFHVSPAFAAANPFGAHNGVPRSNVECFDASFLAFNSAPTSGNKSTTATTQPTENKSVFNDLDMMRISDSFL